MQPRWQPSVEITRERENRRVHGTSNYEVRRRHSVSEKLIKGLGDSPGTRQVVWCGEVLEQDWWQS